MIKRFLYLTVFIVTMLFAINIAYAVSTENVQSSQDELEYVEFLDEFSLFEFIYPLEVFETVEVFGLIDSQESYVLEGNSDDSISVSSASFNFKCPEAISLASSVGWPDELLSRLDIIIWRESRCLTEAFNGSDPNSGSYGLSQVNGFWCRPSRYHPNGWLQEQGILTNCSDLYNPIINITAAKAIYEYSKKANNCGFAPWSTRNKSWC